MIFLILKQAFSKNQSPEGQRFFLRAKRAIKSVATGDLDFSKKPRGAKNAEIPFVRSRMSTCFRRNFQISGFFRETGFSLIKWSKNQKSPDFSGSFKSYERKLRCVKISARSDEKPGFFITTNFWPTFTFFFKTSNFQLFGFAFIRTFMNRPILA